AKRDLYKILIFPRRAPTQAWATRRRASCLYCKNCTSASNKKYPPRAAARQRGIAALLAAGIAQI
ncbi:MAG: hypothetical protein IJR55_04135, partial [Clostridia bacterium]|nr:hypothetical protein [Clostridia bacterium]